MSLQSQESLLYIPDISGFTNFVNQTEIQHSEHIISELLEVLLDSNTLNMTVSEIEGDAILFYKNGEVPDTKDIIEQTKQMYVSFHNHLRYYDARRICNCGACCTAVQLKLKIVAHSGDLGFINVKNRKKPHGKEVILVHRLLKNPIEEKEYLLLTDSLTQKDTQNVLAGSKTVAGSTFYDEIGDVNYNYILLDIFKDQIKDPKPLAKYDKITRPIRYEGFINRNIKEVFEIISNLDLRLTWFQGVDRLKYKKNRVNRVGMKHTCVINGKDIEFETVTDDFGKDRMVFGEKIISAPFVKEFILYNILEEENGGTMLNLEAHYKLIPVVGWIVVPFLKSFFRKNLRNTFLSLKKASEHNVPT